MTFDDYCVLPSATIEEGLHRLNSTSTQILLIVSTENSLLGTVTDGDIRRAFLSHATQSTRLCEIMNCTPLVAAADWSPQQAQTAMKSKCIHHLPVVDDAGRLIGVFTESSLISQQELPNTAVVMVGGLGKRLGEMTKNCPKPMLSIGGRPILETTLEVLRDAGIRNFVFAVNYLAEQIEDYFGDGCEFGVNIQYLKEPEPLGTAGALRLLQYSSDHPLLVMNGDILTRVNIAELIKYHTENRAVATMCVREFNQQVPFGVVDLEGKQIVRLREKPTSRFFVNSGIYVLDPVVLHYIPNNGRFDMPSLFDVLREQQKHTIAYLIDDYWADIGQPQDFAQASIDYSTVFGSDIENDNRPLLVVGNGPKN